MGRLTPAAREQLFRIGRIFLAGLIAQPAIASLAASTLVRYPLVLAVIAAVEATHAELTRRREVIKPGPPAAPPPAP